MASRNRIDLPCPYCFAKGEINLTNNNSTIPSFHSYSKIYTCTNCKQVLDRDFIENPDIPVISIGMIGFAEQGKTRYLEKLLVLLREKQYNEPGWENFQVTPCNEEARNGMFKIDQNNPDGRQRPFCLSLFKTGEMPYLGDQFISFYDPLDGNLFTQSLKIREKAYYLSHCDLIFFMIDLTKHQRDRNPKENLRKLLDLLLLEQILPTNPMLVLLLLSQEFDIQGTDFYSQQKNTVERNPLSRLEAESQQTKNWFIHQNDEYKAFSNILEHQFSSQRVAYTQYSNNGYNILTPLLWSLKLEN